MLRCIFYAQCARLMITEREMEREHQAQLARWKAAKDAKNKPPNSGKKSSAKKSNRNKSPSDS